MRREPSAFSPDEIELLSLLGRLVGSAVQNIRAYEAERTTAEELRRLSALRADFVSLVSHELRSPMASVIGSAQIASVRWRELMPEQRESFLALIAHETSRLAALIGDVLDTSRIEAAPSATRSSTSTSGSSCETRPPRLSAARTRCRCAPWSASRCRGSAATGTGCCGPDQPDRQRGQVLSPGDEVRVEAQTSNGRVVIEVRDRGPGIRRSTRR